MIWLPVTGLATMGIVIVTCLWVLNRNARFEAQHDGPPDPDRLPVKSTALAYLGATVALAIVAAVITGIAP